MSSAAGRSKRVSLTDGRDARVDITRDRDYKARVDVHGPDDRRWVYGVISGTDAEFVSAHDDGGLVTDETPPEWVADVLRSIGLDIE